MIYNNNYHKAAYLEMVDNNKCRLSPRMLATLYLLTASARLRNTMKPVIDKNSIQFSKVVFRKLTPMQYFLLCAAKGIYEDGIEHISIYDLTDKYIIPNHWFELLIQALRIARKGYDEIGIRPVFN